MFPTTPTISNGVGESWIVRWAPSTPRNYDASAAVKHVNDVKDAGWKMIYAETPFLKNLLTNGQIRRLPGPIFNMVTVPHFTGQFYYGFLMS